MLNNLSVFKTMLYQTRLKLLTTHYFLKILSSVVYNITCVLYLKNDIEKNGQLC